MFLLLFFSSCFVVFLPRCFFFQAGLFFFCPSPFFLTCFLGWVRLRFFFAGLFFSAWLLFFSLFFKKKKSGTVFFDRFVFWSGWFLAVFCFSR